MGKGNLRPPPDASLPKEEHRIPQGQGLLHVVGDQEKGPARAGMQVDQDPPEVAAGEPVQGAEGLVQEHQVGLHRQGPPQGGPLSHAAGDLPGVGVPEVPKPHQSQDPIHPGPDLLPGQGLLQPEGQVRLHRQPGHEPGLLKDEAHPDPLPGHLGSSPEEADLPRVGLLQSRQQAEQGGLAAAAAARHREEPPRGDRQGEPLQDPDLPPPEGKGLLQPDDLHPHARASPSHPESPPPPSREPGDRQAERTGGPRASRRSPGPGRPPRSRRAGRGTPRRGSGSPARRRRR